MDHFKESKQGVIKKDDHGNWESSSSSSFSSSDMVDDDNDDASSPRGPLYEFADLQAQLPNIKRGLSKFYNGKSQTFASLRNLKGDEDLEKKEMRNWGIRRRMKSSKSYGENLHKVGPKATITKRSLNPPSFPTKNGIIYH